jgi:ABC-type arginine/histidine transport system permease subunit
MLMFSSAHTALTRATTPTVSWPITVITAFMTGTPLYYQNHVYYSR